ncbi:hypothetical protein SM8_015365 [Streptomyces sp. SM8]|nr:hypothetical protein SM8_015365 [Streptomyces sp. SM8]
MVASASARRAASARQTSTVRAAPCGGAQRTVAAAGPCQGSKKQSGAAAGVSRPSSRSRVVRAARPSARMPGTCSAPARPASSYASSARLQAASSWYGEPGAGTKGWAWRRRPKVVTAGSWAGRGAGREAREFGSLRCGAGLGGARGRECGRAGVFRGGAGTVRGAAGPSPSRPVRGGGAGGGVDGEEAEGGFPAAGGQEDGGEGEDQGGGAQEQGAAQDDGARGARGGRRCGGAGAGRGLRPAVAAGPGR